MKGAFDFHRYSGSGLRFHMPNSRCDNYSTDNSGKIIYEFNQYGFRDYGTNHGNRKNIFFAGCSYTFCLGVTIKDSWPKLLISHLFQDDQKVNIWNFSQAAASNDYITRMMLIQTPIAPPELAIVHFTFANRCELIQEDRVLSIGQWSEEERAMFYYAFYDDNFGILQLIKSMLCCQYTFEHYNVPYVFIAVEHADLLEKSHQLPLSIQQVLRGLNLAHLAPFAITDAQYQIDYAADDSHPGPKSNQKFTNDLAQFIKKIITVS